MGLYKGWERMKKQRIMTKRAREALVACIGTAFMAAAWLTRLSRSCCERTEAFPIGLVIFFAVLSIATALLWWRRYCGERRAPRL